MTGARRRVAPADRPDGRLGCARPDRARARPAARALPSRGAADRARGRSCPTRPASLPGSGPRRRATCARSPWLAVDALAPAVAGVEAEHARGARRDRRDAALRRAAPRHRGAPDQAPRPPAVRDDRRQHGRPQAADRARARAGLGCGAAGDRVGAARERPARSAPGLRRGRGRDAARPARARTRSRSTSSRAGSSCTATPAAARSSVARSSRR